MSNLNGPPDPTKNHPDKIASNNKVIVLSMKNMSSFRFDPTKNFLANTDASGQSVFNFKPQQLVQATSQSAQVGQQASPVGLTQKTGTPGTAGTILIRAQSSSSGVASKPQFTPIANCPNVKIQETSEKNQVSISKEVTSTLPQAITKYRKTVLIHPASVIKPQGVIASSVQVASGLKGITLSPSSPSQFKRIVSSTPTTPNLIVSNIQTAVSTNMSPTRLKIDQQQLAVPSVTEVSNLGPGTYKWTVNIKENSASLPVPPLTLIIQPKVKKVDIIQDTIIKNAHGYLQQQHETPEEKIEKQKRTSQEERLLEVKRIIEGDQETFAEQVGSPQETCSVQEENELENDDDEPFVTEELPDSSSSMLLCDEKIENVSPETSPLESEKSKDVPATPVETDEDKGFEINPLAKEVRKNLSQELECDKENVSITIDDESMSNDSSMIDVQKQTMQDYEETLMKSQIAKTCNQVVTTTASVIQAKAKRIRKPKNPTIIATLGLPYKPSQPSSRKSKVERKLEFELDFHDPLNKIQWDDGIGGLDDCNKLFGFDEFGLIEVLNKKDAMAKLTQLDIKPLLLLSTDKQETKSYKLRKIVDPIDLFECSVCAKLGTIRDFYCPECCSETCLAITKRKVGDNGSTAGKESSSESGVSTPIDERKLMFMGEMVPLQQLQQHLLEQQVPESKRKPSSKRLPFISPPEEKFQWESYLTVKSNPAPLKLFKNPYPRSQNPFKVGMKLEAIDPGNQKLICVATVEEKLGYRMKLHFDGYSTAYDFWVNADSPNIFPSGFCQSTGRSLETPPKWGIKKFDWSEYLDYTNSIGALRALFPRISSELNVNPFEIGMKLETLRDGKLYAASIIDVLEERVLVLIDGHEELGCNWLHMNSPYLHPCNYHKTLEDPESFIPPTPGPFNWTEYLKSTKSKEAPSKFLYFRKRAPYKFEPGLKLEIVDVVNRQLIRPATVLCRTDYKVQVIFDGFDINFAYWLDDDSEDLHPINWCEKTCHPIEHPAGFNKSLDNGLCISSGCRGIGNGVFPESYFHDNAQECPYLPFNWKKLLHQKPKSHVDSKVVTKRSNKQNVKETSTGGSKSGLKEEIKDEDDLSIDIVLSSSKTTLEKTSKRTAIKRKAQDQNDEETSAEKSTGMKVAKVFLEDYGPQLNYAYAMWKKNSKVLDRATIGGQSTANPSEWSCENVCSFISKIVDDETVATKFKENEIDGAAFICLHQDDLINLMNIKLGTAIKIYNRILHLRQETALTFIKT